MLVQVDMLCHMSGMEPEPKDQRVPVMFSASEVRAVDDWRRTLASLPSRSEAIRSLVRVGLETMTKAPGSGA